MDRYSYSGVAFTMAKEIEGLDMDWCQTIERGKLPEPDIIFYMDLSVQSSSRRPGFGSEAYEKREFQEAVQKAFEKLRNEKWTVIDADRSFDDISFEILPKALQAVIECRNGRPLRKLWMDEAFHVKRGS